MPLFVSHTTLKGYKRLFSAAAPWALDSGGFTQLDTHGRWSFTPAEYVEAVQRYQEEIGQLVWCAPMDWMCEERILAKTGLTVRHHQERTVENYLELRDQIPVIPVLQGFTLDEYLICVDLYEEAGVELAELPTVGIGSVCRRQHTKEVARIVRAVANRGIRLHGFGVKKTGLPQYGHLLASADSMAWSFRARNAPPLPGHTHKNCANCLPFALQWRDELLVTSTPIPA